MVPPGKDHSFLDDPEILKYIFYPRREDKLEPSLPNTTDRFVPVEEDIHVGCRFYFSQQLGPNILFFHGNGEIVSDYDTIAPLYGERGINLFVADYRGYGFSGGTPTVSNMIHDAPLIFSHFVDFARENKYGGPLYVMGRSLGSGSALEIASKDQDHLKGLIIESGFANTFDLLNSLGIPIRIPSGTEDHIVSNVEKIRTIFLPTLIIHAETDHLIPLSHARTLYEASPSPEKRVVIIPGADHNDLLLVGMDQYFEALLDFVSGGNLEKDQQNL
jgi:alpha-beta hydrolase superfamily lysophospholipase